MAAKKKKPAGSPESIKALEASMQRSAVPERPDEAGVILHAKDRAPVAVVDGKAKSLQDVATDAPKKRGRKPKDAELPGMVGEGVERVEHPDIDDAADQFQVARDDWQARFEPMMQARAKVIALMKSYGLKRYTYDGTEVALNPPGEEKLKVKKVADHKVELEED